jgi:hypothetical protein
MMAVVRVSLPLVPAIVTATGSVPGLVGAVIVSVVCCPLGTAALLKLQLAPLGRPEQAELEKFTVPLNEPTATTVSVLVPEAPALMLSAGGLAEMTKSLAVFTFHSLTRL